MLIGVRAVSAQYMTVDKPQPLVLLEIVKSKMTGKTPEMGQVRNVSLRRRQAASPPKRAGAPAKRTARR